MAEPAIENPGRRCGLTGSRQKVPVALPTGPIRMARKSTRDSQGFVHFSSSTLPNRPRDVHTIFATRSDHRLSHLTSFQFQTSTET